MNQTIESLQTPEDLAPIVAEAEQFLRDELGESLHGSEASLQLVEGTKTREEAAKGILKDESKPLPEDGLRVALGKIIEPGESIVAGTFDEAYFALQGFLVLVHSNLVDPDTDFYYPALVRRNDSVPTNSPSDMLRLHVFKHRYLTNSFISQIILSGAGQSELPGMEDPDHIIPAGAGPTHFLNLTAGGVDQVVQAKWLSGDHLSHTEWMENPRTSSALENARLLRLDQVPLEISREDINRGRKHLLWHRDMVDGQGNPLSASEEDALPAIQAIALRRIKQLHEIEKQRQGLDKSPLIIVQRMIERRAA